MARINFKDRRLLGGVALVGLVGIAAVMTDSEQDRLFASMDANRDGFITRNEAWADTRVEQRFALADRNLDGKLDRAEFYELLDAERRGDKR